MIHEYLTYLQNNKGLSANTLIAYNKDLKAFVTWAQPKGLRWSTITRQNIDEYIGQLEISPATTRRKISAIRQLFTWMHHEGLLTQNVARYLQSPKAPEQLPQAADGEVIERYLALHATTSQRETIQAVVALIKDTGLRIQECLDLRITDMSAKAHTIRVTGKGNKERIVYYTDAVIPYLAKVYGRRDNYLIPVGSQRTIRQMMQAELGTHPHAIRHLFATDMINRGASLTAIGHLLGHKSTSTTERYAKVANTFAQQQYTMYH